MGEKSGAIVKTFEWESLDSQENVTRGCTRYTAQHTVPVPKAATKCCEHL